VLALELGADGDAAAMASSISLSARIRSGVARHAPSGHIGENSLSTCLAASSSRSIVPSKIYVVPR
jgi:hypothetical protein